MADGEHGFLGLTHNPFATESQDFFDGADRLKSLEQLRHLGQWSRQITLVTGPLGIGKTSLFRQLSMTLEPRVKAARINGVLVNTLRDVLYAVAQGVGAPVSAEAASQVLAEVLATYFIGQERQGRFGLILVDDAHLLDYGSVEELLKLTRNSPVRLCLFGEPSLVNAVSKPAQRQEISWHELRLNAFNQAELQAFVDWKLAQAGFRGKTPFSAGQLAKLLKMSGGLPAQINQISADLIDRLESGQTESGMPKFPVAHGLIVVLLVVVVSLAYLVLSGIEPEITQDSLSEKTPAEMATTTLALPGAESPEASQQGTDSPEARSSEADSSEAGSSQASTAAAVSADSPVADAPAGGSELAPDVAEAGATSTPTKPPAPVLTPMPDPLELQSRRREAEREAESVAGTTAGTTDSVEAVPAQTSVPVRPVAAPASVAGARNADWLLAQPSSAWTVQLASFSTEERLRDYIAAQADRSAFGWYPIERGGKRLFVITYGQFASKSEAESAAKALPPATGKVEPWVRPMSMVKEAINALPR